MSIYDLQTPAALVDEARMMRNVRQMKHKIVGLGAALRPHIKTTKCNAITNLLLQHGACGVTVSTMKEAEETFKAGVSDILYAVCIAPNKLSRAYSLILEGCDLKLLTDSVAGARAIAEFGVRNNCTMNVLIEIDTDDHRSGVKPDAELLLDVARALQEESTEAGGARVAGVMTHAGESYALNNEAELVAFAEQERTRCVRAAERLVAAGFECPMVSIGSTPTALSYAKLGGVTEVRAGVYVFFDLVMHNVGVCTLDDIALSVLTSVIGHQPEKGWVIVDAGWMALSRDRGTHEQLKDFGYGQVCDVNCVPIEGAIVEGANQEHGIVKVERSVDVVREYPVGTLLRVLPNHACATAAQFNSYSVIGSNGSDVIANWETYGGW
ncbi:unnamed protein product [Ectocarpus fasciculatus]